MSLKFATVDNDAVEILNNKVVGSNSRFDGKEIKTNKDINAPDIMDRTIALLVASPTA